DIDDLAHSRGLGSDPNVTVEMPPASSAQKRSSAIKLVPEEDVLGAPPAPTPGASQDVLGQEPLAAGGSKKGTAAKKGGESDVRLVLESGSFEFDLTVDSSGRLVNDPGPGGAAGGAPPAGKSGLGSQQPVGSRKSKTADDEVSVDFDSATLNDSRIHVGDKPDSDVRIDPISLRTQSPSGSPPPETEEIDLD